MQVVVLYALNGLTYSMLLFLMAAGLTLILGLQNILNLAHGSFYIIGSYLAVEMVEHGYPFVLAVLVIILLVTAAGGLIHRLLLRRLGQNHRAQLLMTIGIVFVVEDIVLAVWGGDVLSIPPPIAGVTTFGSVSYPTYRLAVIAIGVAMAVALGLVQNRTRLGAMVRAGVDDPEMAEGVGIPLPKIMTAVFAGGAALAGLGGALAVPITGVETGTDLQVLLLALAIVVIGGAGSLGGAFIASIVIGVVYSVGTAEFPVIDQFAVFLPMAIVLTIRPTGLWGRQWVH